MKVEITETKAVIESTTEETCSEEDDARMEAWLATVPKDKILRITFEVLP